jgi:tetratricopeptide (TPR) repeat protein
MFALSHVYGVPIAALAERFEVDLLREVAGHQVVPETAEAALAHLKRLKLIGDYSAGIPYIAAAREAFREAIDADAKIGSALSLYEVDFLIHLERYELAKVKCEQVVSRGGLDEADRLMATISFSICCYRLKRYSIAEMALDQVLTLRSTDATDPRLVAMHRSVRGAVASATGRHEAAVDAFREAVTLYQEAGDPFEACRAQTNAASSLIDLGCISEAMEILRKALHSAEEGGYDRLKAIGLSHMALICFRRNDLAAAESYALRSNVLARAREFLSVVFRNCYYLREIARRTGDAAAAATNERTLRAYLHRVDSELVEAVMFRSETMGGAS